MEASASRYARPLGGVHIPHRGRTYERLHAP